MKTVPQLLAEIHAEKSAEKSAEPTRKPSKNWRAEWVKEVGKCQNPDCSNDYIFIASIGVHVHEICKGQHRKKAKEHREVCLVLCDVCNGGVFCDYGIWPIARQCALKLITDPLWFDLPLVNKLRSRASDAITLADLVPYLTLKMTP